MARRVPYYAQTSDFSCGPACVLMALGASGKLKKLTRTLEFEVWRDTNAIGMRGANPWGVAIAAATRGLPARVLAPPPPIFPFKRLKARAGVDGAKVALWSEKEQLSRARELGVSWERDVPDLSDVAQSLASAELPIVLVYAHQAAHWVLVHDMNEKTVTYHDPWERDGGPSVKRAHARFEKLMRRLDEFGIRRAMVAIGARNG